MSPTISQNQQSVPYPKRCTLQNSVIMSQYIPYICLYIMTNVATIHEISHTYIIRKPILTPKALNKKYLMQISFFQRNSPSKISPNSPQRYADIDSGRRIIS